MFWKKVISKNCVKFSFFVFLHFLAMIFAYPFFSEHYLSPLFPDRLDWMFICLCIPFIVVAQQKLLKRNSKSVP